VNRHTSYIEKWTTEAGQRETTKEEDTY